MRRFASIAVAVMITVVSGACGSDSPSGSSGSSSGERPSTTARLEIVAPKQDATTAPDTTVQFNLIGAKILPLDQVSGPLRPDEGHIHATVDGQTQQMTGSLELPLKGLAPGPHTIQAEFVAVDHAPFKDRVITAVIFEVKP